MKLFSSIGGVFLPSRQISRPARLREGPSLEHVAAMENLQTAWRRVRANKGGPGADRITVDAFAATAEQSLSRLSRDLLSKSYRPYRLNRVRIPKKNGGTRTLSIPSVIDRIAQTAVLISLAPSHEPRMSEASWAYRPGRGTRDALASIEEAYANGFGWTVDADIASYFDRVPHEQLLAELAIWIDDERILGLLGCWLRGFGRRRRGIAQGSPISPLLANLYLHPLDRLVVAAGYPLIRYADDMVALARSEDDARRALRLLVALLKSRGLQLNARKTTIRAPEESFRFLGETITATKQ